MITFEARRADELARMLERHGATIQRAPALREVSLGQSTAALELARRLDGEGVDAVILLTGVGTRALAAAVAETHPRFVERLAQTTIVARGPKPLAALRELGVTGAHAVAAPHTWRQVLDVVDGLGLPTGGRVAVQEYGAPPAALVEGLAQRGFDVLQVPVYRWALPDDIAPLLGAVATLARGAADVVVFTSAVQVEHLFRVADDAAAVRAGLRRAVVASIGPVCSEALEAHEVPPDLEAVPPKLGPLVALVADRAGAVLAGKR